MNLIPIIASDSALALLSADGAALSYLNSAVAIAGTLQLTEISVPNLLELARFVRECRPFAHD